MKRVLIINPTLRVGGVERKIADMAHYLAQHDDPRRRIVLFLEQGRSQDAHENVFFDLVQESPFQIHVKPAAPVVPFLVYLLYQVLKQKPDVILAFSRRPSILALTIRRLLWWRKLRVIVGNDSIASQALALYVPHPLMRRALAAQMRWLYPSATLFLVPSETSRLDLMEHFRVPTDKIRVFKNWTHSELKKPGFGDKERRLPKHYDLIYVGRVDAVKRLTRLVRIIALVRKELPALRVVVVGDGNDMANAKRASLDAGLAEIIAFVGFQADIGGYLAQSKIFCLTSQFEGLPMAALEAMAYALPVVTLAYAGAHELVQSGHTGYICASEEAFCTALVRLLTDEALRADMGNQAQAYVRREHGEQVLAEYVNLIFNSD